MPNKCFVPACKSGYLSNTKKLKLEGNNVPHMFHSPEVNTITNFYNYLIIRCSDVGILQILIQ